MKHGVGVELFAFPSDYCDVATLSTLAQTTGGEIHLYPKLQVSVYNVCVECSVCVVCVVYV